MVVTVSGDLSSEGKYLIVYFSPYYIDVECYELVVHQKAAAEVFERKSNCNLVIKLLVAF